MTKFPEWTGPGAPDVSSLPNLTALEGFDAMRLFIENFWKRGLEESNDLRLLLSAMDRDSAIWVDGGPSDPAMWSDWLLALGQLKDVDLSGEAQKLIRHAPPHD